jgi:hypothetical protein
LCAYINAVLSSINISDIKAGPFIGLMVITLVSDRSQDLWELEEALRMQGMRHEAECMQAAELEGALQQSAHRDAIAATKAGVVREFNKAMVKIHKR